MLVLLSVDCLQVAFLGVPLLQVELLLQLQVADVGVHLYDVVPEGLLLVVGLLDLADCQV